MEGKTTGIVTKVSRQWWLKRNSKPLRITGADGAEYPHIIRVSYSVDGREYTRRKWLPAGAAAVAPGARVDVVYRADAPAKATIII